MAEDYKQIKFRLPAETARKLKVYLAATDQTLQAYMEKLVTETIEKLTKKDGSN
jgi:predicted DNA-binding protein